jgi:hypothetical protein
MHQDPTQAIAHYGEEAITAIFPIFYLTVNDRHNGATDFRRNGASEKG